MAYLKLLKVVTSDAVIVSFQDPRTFQKCSNAKELLNEAKRLASEGVKELVR